jgi:hypothetical protein
MLVAYFEVAMGPEDNKPIRVTPILGPKKSLIVLHRGVRKIFPRWGGWSLDGGEEATPFQTI